MPIRDYNTGSAANDGLGTNLRQAFYNVRSDFFDLYMSGSGFAAQITSLSGSLNTSGANLQSSINSLISWTGSTTGLYARKSETGNFITAAQTGAFYPSIGNPSGFVRATSGTPTMVGGTLNRDGLVFISSTGSNSFEAAAISNLSGIAMGSGSGSLSIGIAPISFNLQTGSTYTITGSDVYKMIAMSGAAAQTLIVPTQATVPYMPGINIDIVQEGAGQVTISGANGVTIRSRGSVTKISGQYGMATLLYRTADIWYLAGDLGA